MSAARPVALVGLRCAGKSTVGRLLAESLDRAFLDLDREVVVQARRAGIPTESAGELLARAGKAVFRDCESAALRRILEATPEIVLATGGGVVERRDSCTWLTRTAVVVYLRARPEVLAARMQRDATARPGLLGTDPVAEIPAIFERRDALYHELAQHVLEVDEDPPDRVVRRLETLLGVEGVSRE